MRKIMQGAIVGSLLAGCVVSPPKTTTPRLVVAISVDQLRPDYLRRLEPHFLPPQQGIRPGGFRWLEREGADYRDAAYWHMATFTCPGHATILSGATPAVHGIVGNRWYDRESRRVVSCVDPLGSEQGPRSPRSMLASTIGDELKLATNDASRVVTLGIKDYAVMAFGGRMADVALWLNRNNGEWVSNDYYFGDQGPPEWVQGINSEKLMDRYLGEEWNFLLEPDVYQGTRAEPAHDEENEAGPYGYGWQFPHLMGEETDRGYYSRVVASPFANEFILDTARRAIDVEGLGQDESPDLLALALSSNDYVGHSFGPSSPEVLDITLRTDRQLADFFGYLTAKFRKEELLIVLTSDHGVQYAPREIREGSGFAGRVSGEELRQIVQKALEAEFGPGNWVAAVTDLDLYLNQELIVAKELEAEEVEMVAAQALLTLPGIQQAYSRQQVLEGQLSGELGARVADSFHFKRSGDLFLVYSPNWFKDEPLLTTHGTHHPPNAQVPLILWGAGVQPGRHYRRVDPRDIAPTLSLLLGIGYPSGSSGRPLHEVFQR